MNKPRSYSHALVWLRRDLRLSDHRALYEACRCASKVSLVFVYDSTILDRLQDQDDRRVTFIYESVQEVDTALRSKGSALITLHGDPCIDIPELARRLKAEAVFCNRDYEPHAKERDETVSDRLGSMGIAFYSLKDQVVFEGLEVSTQKGEAFRVFTPYKNAWLKKCVPEDIREFKPNFKKLSDAPSLRGFLNKGTLKSIGFTPSRIWLTPGEKAASVQFRSFLKRIDRYDEERDIPSLATTSGLSVHLRFGTLSIRKLFREAMKRNTKGAVVWVSELIWREFYQMILDRFPRVVNEAFLPQYRNLKWPGKPSHFKAWCEGRTGYPLVDAAMRHFNQTGWMHNRLRMVVASFLVKDLLIDWKKGEAWFARHLLDFDLAANNGGWQWCASTGCDAQPWFRIFNPVTQSKRFDPEGKFIRSVIPELAGYSNKHIHWPSGASAGEQTQANCVVGKDYPRPIVEHKAQREKILKILKN